MALTLLHHWAFNENTGDSVAEPESGNTGTLLVGDYIFGGLDPSTGDPPDGTNLAWVTGRNGGYAVKCNGAVDHDFDYMYTATQVASGGIGNFAIAIWIKQDSAVAGYAGPIFGMMNTQKWSSSYSHGNFVWIRLVDATYYLCFGSSSTNMIQYSLGSDGLNDGNWRCIIAAWCAGVGYLLLDGNEVVSGNLTEFTNAGWWRAFGSYMPSGESGSFSIPAIIDDIKVYLGCITDCHANAIFNDEDPTACDAIANANAKMFVFSGGLT